MAYREPVDDGAAPEVWAMRANVADDRPPASIATASRAPDTADRRARTRLRRYAVSNGLGRLLTLTYAPPQPTDAAVVYRDVVALLRWLRGIRPDLAYGYTLERHQSGALHVHVGLSSLGRKLDRAAIAGAWGHGFIDLRKMRSTRPGRRENARGVARYLAKYIGKDGTRLPGGHRYEVRQGRQPETVRAAALTIDEGWRQLVGLAGGEVPAYEWSSSGDPEWTGPPLTFLAWA